MRQIVILWFRLDLRLKDNWALNAAMESGYPILPLYIDYEAQKPDWKVQGASAWWLHQALNSLQQNLNFFSSRLIIAKGDPLHCFEAYGQHYDIKAIYAGRRYEPFEQTLETKLSASLKAKGIPLRLFNNSLLHEPDTIKNKAGQAFQVFTPFWKHCLSLQKDSPQSLDLKSLQNPSKWPESLSIDHLKLLPKTTWYTDIQNSWDASEKGAHKALKRFLEEVLKDYESKRDYPDTEGTSRLSPYLHYGQLSPRYIWQKIQSLQLKNSSSVSKYLAELGWREFAYHLLHHFPATPHQPLRSAYQNFPWVKNPTHLEAWKKGQTGYPIVDAGLRQLWQTGWMHNRVRMIVASFLVKHLLLPWQEGARWFWDTLVDADLASNTLGWQWVSGCGADAAPYFRIFNPILQGEKFDPKGHYIKKYLPILSEINETYIHQPWNAPPSTLRHAGIELGENYPLPLVDHAFARTRALNALEEVAGGAPASVEKEND